MDRAFGLSAADGVVKELVRDGRGHPTPVTPVPIVPAAVVFDLKEDVFYPGPEEGASAYRAASTEPVVLGRVGAGTATSSAKWRGFEHMVFTGVGSAVVPTPDGHLVGALVVLNPVGDVFSLAGDSLTGGDPIPGPPGIPPRPGHQHHPGGPGHRLQARSSSPGSIGHQSSRRSWSLYPADPHPF